MIQRLHHVYFWMRTFIVGIFGGIFFSLFFIVLSFFHMIEIKPKNIVQPFYKERFTFLLEFPTLTFIVIVTIISCLVAIVYALLFKKKMSLLIGAIYGFIFWVLLYFFLPYFLTHYVTLEQVSFDSHVASSCLFILYGAFIGYSISFSYHSLHDDKAEKEA